MTLLLVLAGVVLWIGLSVAIVTAYDAYRGAPPHSGFWSSDATNRVRRQIRIAGRGQAGIVRVRRGWLW